MPFLLTKSELVADKRIEFQEQTITIGRHPECEVVIDESSVSRKHAEISCADGMYFIQDLKSRNGTLVDRSEIQGKVCLLDGSNGPRQGSEQFLLEQGSQPATLFPVRQLGLVPNHIRRRGIWFGDKGWCWCPVVDGET